MKLNEYVEFDKLHVNNKIKPTSDLYNLSRFDNPITGIEVEVENLRNFDRDFVCNNGWCTDSDGSLRNSGIEFISNPIQPEVAETVINTLFNDLKKRDVHFSPRTSIHVHLNCRDLHEYQIYNIAILYQCFEDLFYNYAGPERKKSIFCVPVGNTSYYNNLKKDIMRNHQPSWNKYTGLNLGPLHTLGTVEFRHLRGTNNVDVICTWLNILYTLYRFATNMSTDELEKLIVYTSNNETYQSFGNQVFGDLFSVLCNNTAWTKNMRQDMSISKLFMYNENKGWL